MIRRQYLSNSPEDQKLLTLAKATMARSNSKSAAALRDTTGRTYVAIPVKSKGFAVDSLLAVLVVAKASQITGIEAIVITGEISPMTSIEIVRAESPLVKIYSATDTDELLAI